MPARRLLALVPLALLVPACGGGAVKQTVQVSVTGSQCRLGAATVPAGRTAFAVDNRSGSEAEAYVYDANGKKVDEVEGIANATTRTLKVTLKPGSYSFACKPEGKDIRTPFTVS